MQAIEVQYKGPTEHKGARLIVRAGCNGRSKTYNADELTVAEAVAAYVLFRDWQSLPGDWVGGETRTGTVFVRVFTADHQHSDRQAPITNSTFKVYQ